MYSITYNNDRVSGGHGTVAFPKFAYVASPGAGLKLTTSICKTRTKNQSKAPTVFFIKGVRNALATLHAVKIWFAVRINLPLITMLYCTVTAVLVCVVATYYSIRAVNSSKILARIRTQTFAIFRTLRRVYFAKIT